jgi:hypothetical protein
MAGAHALCTQSHWRASAEHHVRASCARAERSLADMYDIDVFPSHVGVVSCVRSARGGFLGTGQCSAV